MEEGLLHFFSPGPQKLRILTVESTLYLSELHRRMPQAELYAVTAYEEVPELPTYQQLPVKWQVLDFRKDALPYEKHFFDYIFSEGCLENALEPLTMATELGALLKDTGHLLTSFSNIRYWRVLEELRAGHFYAQGRHLFAKPEVVKLLNDALYKEIAFSPFQQDSVPEEIAIWEDCGFENYSQDLATETWLVKASRSTAEIAALKDCYTPEIRRRLAVLLHRIEYGIDGGENLARLWEFCDKNFIFPAYLLGFVQETVIHREKILQILMVSARNLGREDFLQELTGI